ncbi:unnamed protein product, partial [Laminaria digitata]
LLKLATLLYSASRVEEEGVAEGGGGGGGGISGFGDNEPESPLVAQIGNVKEARALATEITSRGSRLYELLGKESEARPQRLRAVAFLEASDT